MATIKMKVNENMINPALLLLLLLGWPLMLLPMDFRSHTLLLLVVRLLKELPGAFLAEPPHRDDAVVLFGWEAL